MHAWEFGHDAFLESRLRSFSSLWEVAPDYRVENGVIVPIALDQKPQAYLPMAHPELPGEFAKLAGQSEAEILTFVRRYGLLGYDRAFRILELASTSAEGLHDPEITGDPIAWILAHADAVALVLRLVAALGNPKQLGGDLQRLLVRDKLHGEYLSFKHPYRGYTYPADVKMRPRASEQESALEIIAHIINDNLEGVSRELIIENQEMGALDFTSLFSPENLLDCIYWLLADAVIGRRVKQCEYCHHFFTTLSRKVRYCPPLMGYIGVSPCMNRAKVERFRENHRVPGTVAPSKHRR